jgi:hypothetical protein
MWVRDGRRFWFYDQYVLIHDAGCSSVERTRERLDEAFEQWESCNQDVIYSGPWGWFDPQTCRFERDRGDRSEEWDISGDTLDWL